MTTTYALDIQGLRITLPGTARPVLDGVDLTVAAGETVALVGESGSGKTLTSRSALRLLPPGALVEGTVAVGGEAVLAMNAERVTALRTGTAAMIFQDPRAAINPLRRIGDFLTEGVVLPKVMKPARRDGPCGRTPPRRGRRGLHPRQVPGPGVRRHAPARHDRRGPHGRPLPAARGRADHGARRHEPGRGRRPPRPAPAAIRHGAAVRHPRPRPGRRPQRPRLRHVRRTDRRERPRERPVRPPLPPLHRGAAGLHPSPRRALRGSPPSTACHPTCVRP